MAKLALPNSEHADTIDARQHAHLRGLGALSTAHGAGELDCLLDALGRLAEELRPYLA